MIESQVFCSTMQNRARAMNRIPLVKTQNRNNIEGSVLDCVRNQLDK
jgi:hypothetical protein